MEQNLKYSTGTDISKESFDACLSVIKTSQRVTIKATRKFKNTPSGFREFIAWQKKGLKEDIPHVITVEATGVYYESFALAMHKEGFSVSVVLPNKSKKYLQAKGLKSKNDKIDAKGLAQMGAEQCLEKWEPFSESIYELRSLTRQHEDLQNQRTMIMNKLEAINHAAYRNSFIGKQLKKMQGFIEKQIGEISFQIEKSIEKDGALKSKIENICKVKGLGILTVATIVAETNGFKLFRNQRQLVSYAGYDVVQNQSGKKEGKTKISKKGNSHIRRALHMPALNVVRYEQGGFLNLQARIFERSGYKMKGYVAVQRKLLILIYTLWKKDEEFDANYYRKQDNTCGEMEPKPFFSLNSEGITKKIGGLLKPPTQDKLPYETSPEAFFSLTRI